MPTYVDVQKCVKAQFGFVPKTCWIAHVKELNGLNTRRAQNRGSGSRKYPCPTDKRIAIEKCLRHLGVI